MKIGELAQRIHVSRIHAWRLARAGIVPGTRKTKGGQFYFVEDQKLKRWINLMIGGAHRKKEMARAYSKHYGSERLQHGREIRGLKADFKKALRSIRRASFKRTSDENYFYHFQYSIGQLTKILEELTQWRESKLKAEIVTMSRERLTILSNLINEWLSSHKTD